MSNLDIIRELNRVKAEFQLRTIATVIGFPAQGMAARSHETAQPVRPEGQQPDPKGCAQ